jgi:hypothetical protein
VNDPSRIFFGSYASGLVPATPIGLDLYYLGLQQPDTAYNGTTGDEQRHSTGARIFGRVGETGFDYDIEGAYQFGEVGGADVSAYMLASELGYTAARLPFAPRFLVGVDYGSGDEQEGDGDVETFNPLFPDGHDDFGNMDAVGAQNALGVKAGLVLRPTRWLAVSGVLHYLRRARSSDDFYDGGGAAVRDDSLSGSRRLGFETNLGARIDLGRHVAVETGWSHFFPGSYIRNSGAHAQMDSFHLTTVFTF